MWNSGDASDAVTGPDSLREAIARGREAQPDLRFQIEVMLADSDLVAVVGIAQETPLIWLIRMQEGRMAEMWTFQSVSV
jgi:predicted ester cyclase